MRCDFFLILLLGCASEEGIKSHNSNPEVSITSHQNGDILYIGDEILFRAVASDPNHTYADLRATWLANGNEICTSQGIEIDGTTLCTHTITANDTRVIVEIRDPTNAVGSDILDVALEEPNTPPECNIITPIEGAQFLSTESISAAGVVYDAEQNPTTLAASWLIDGVSIGSVTPDSSGTVIYNDLLLGGTHTIALTATDAQGVSCTAERTVIVNAVPSQPIVIIAPDPAYTYNDLIAIPSDSIDDNGDTITYHYSWYKNGSLTAHNNEIIAAVETSKGDVWKVEVTPDDGQETGTMGTTEVVILNTPPQIDSISIVPTSIYTNDIITAQISTSDNDGDSVYPTYHWYVDGVLVYDGGETLDGSLYFEKDQTVYAEVFPSDNEDIGNPNASSSITILNSPPEAPILGIVVTETCEEEMLCDIVQESFDADGDPISYTIDWLQNGSPVNTGLDTNTWTDDTVQVGVFSEGEEWTCQATPNDGTDSGDIAEEIQNITCGEETICSGYDLGAAHLSIVEDPGRSMDENWAVSAANLGYSYSMISNSDLNNTSFFSTTDVLVIVEGTGSYNSAQIAIIQDFMEQGGSVYFQSEYNCNYTSNQGVSTILNSYGAGFSWTGTVNGDLNPTQIVGCMSQDAQGNPLPSLTYYWYGCNASSASSNYDPFLQYNGSQLGFAYCSGTAGHGMLITTTDQDWVNNTSHPNAENLRQQILLRLANAPSTCP